MKNNHNCSYLIGKKWVSKNTKEVGTVTDIVRHKKIKHCFLGDKQFAKQWHVLIDFENNTTNVLSLKTGYPLGIFMTNFQEAE